MEVTTGGTEGTRRREEAECGSGARGPITGTRPVETEGVEADREGVVTICCGRALTLTGAMTFIGGAIVCRRGALILVRSLIPIRLGAEA